MIVKTIGLTSDKWDIALDGAGNLPVIKDKSATAQDVASACMTVLGEQIFDSSIGVPMFTDILGENPSNVYLQSIIERCAKTISSVDDALCVVTKRENRKENGYIYVTTKNDEKIEIII